MLHILEFRHQLVLGEDSWALTHALRHCNPRVQCATGMKDVSPHFLARLLLMEVS